jgi:hypothetical protein
MLTPRQSALFSLLRENQDQYLTQYQISQMLSNLYFFGGEQKDFHDSKSRLRIMKDIRKINDDPDIPAIVVSNANGVKIANEAESKASMKAEYAAIFRKLRRAYAKERKITRDGQLVFAPNGDMTVYKIFDALSEEGGDNEQTEKGGATYEE